MSSPSTMHTRSPKRWQSPKTRATSPPELSQWTLRKRQSTLFAQITPRWVRRKLTAIMKCLSWGMADTKEPWIAAQWWPMMRISFHRCLHWRQVLSPLSKRDRIIQWTLPVKGGSGKKGCETHAVLQPIIADLFKLKLDNCIETVTQFGIRTDGDVKNYYVVNYKNIFWIY